jgi:dihydropteroate synthase
MDLGQIPGFGTKKRVLIMGVLNVTPDSFSDGGLTIDPQSALARAREMVREGADLIDVGAESSRPGALPVSLEEELSRVRPVLACLKAGLPRFPLSIDTSKAAVAREAIDHGAVIVNDISAGRVDPAMFGVVKEAQVPMIFMHMRGTPRSMQERPVYRDVVGEISDFFEERLAAAHAQGVPKGMIFLDPGIGFGKTVEHNLEILARLDEFGRLGRPLVVGTSRKSFIGGSLSERLEGTLASCLWAIQKGARVLRVHDVKACARGLAVWNAIQNHAVRC